MSGPKVCPQCGAEYELDQRFCPQDGTTLRLKNATGDLLGAIVADRYHVLRKLGEGGMGQVYLAEHVKMGRKSALKVMNPALVKDADAISRFNREASNASRINHPNVADVYDFGETPEGITYLAMEFVDGPALTKLIETEGPLSPERTATIVRQTADALAVAHDMGIVHRDLKPDNIMITRDRDGRDCVKIVDFGIAKAAANEAQKVTKTGLVIGTPEYMSPEQLAGDALDGRSDIYALALVAFNMLTGRLPFPAETAQESMIMRLTEAPRKLAEMRPDVAWPVDVQAALDKALQRDASARYPTAAEFGRALSEALGRMASAPERTLPITRVAPPRRPEAPSGAAQEAGSPVGASPRRRNYAPAYAVGGVTLAAVVVGAAMALNRSGAGARSPAATRDSVTRLGQATSDGKVPGASQFAKGMDSSSLASGRPGTGGIDATAPSAEVTAALDSLEKVVSRVDVTPNEAAGVIRAVEQMKSRMKGDEQLVQAGIVKALAWSSRNNNAAACAALRSVRPIAPGTKRARQVERTMSVCD